MNKNIKVYIAGHNGLVGSAIVRRLKKAEYNNLIHRTHKELDLVNQREVDNFFCRERPEWVFFGCSKSWWNNGKYRTSSRIFIRKSND